MKISEIIYEGEFTKSDISHDEDFSRLTYTAQDTDCSSILIIPTSEKFNPQDLKSSPIAIICDEKASVPETIPAIRVNDARLALSLAYYRFYNPDLTKLTLIGITGTNGKTSTATFISDVLGDLGIKVGLIGTGIIKIGNQEIQDNYYSMTTPDPWTLYHSMRKMVDAGCTAIVMEVSSHALALEKVAPLSFNYAIFTNLSDEHLDFHLDKEDYYKAKATLFKKSDCAIINYDDIYGRRLYKEATCRKLSVGLIKNADIVAKNIKNKGLDGIEYTYINGDLAFDMHLETAGEYNVYNSMLAAAVCIDMGLEPFDVKTSIQKTVSIPGRFEIIKEQISVIIDYAHTQEAFERFLCELSKIKDRNRLIVIFGCGGQRDRSKRPKMASIAEKYADKIIVTSDNTRNEDPDAILSDIIKGFSQNNHTVISDRAEAIEYVISNADDGDIVAIIGKGREKYNIDANGYHPFDEREIISSALKKRGDLCE